MKPDSPDRSFRDIYQRINAFNPLQPLRDARRLVALNLESRLT
jgi:hypothetical protein